MPLQCPQCFKRVERPDLTAVKGVRCPYCGASLWTNVRPDQAAVERAFGGKPSVAASPTPAVRPPPTQAERQQAFAANASGVALSNQGAYRRALREFSRALRLDPQMIPAYNNRGYAHAACRTFDQALADFNEALRLDPRFAAAGIVVGSVFHGAHLGRGTAWGPCRPGMGRNAWIIAGGGASA